MFQNYAGILKISSVEPKNATKRGEKKARAVKMSVFVLIKEECMASAGRRSSMERSNMPSHFPCSSSLAA